MRTFFQTLASSTFFGSTGAAFSTSAAGTSAQFFTQGAVGGPVHLRNSKGLTLQANFGGNGNPSSGTYGGQLNLLGSDVLEKSMFVQAASAFVSSTGSVIFNMVYPNYRYVDFQFIPSSAASSTGILSVYLKVLEDGV